MAQGQKWPDVDREVREFIGATLDLFSDHLGANLDAVILHGSLAMGCFYPPKSDIDLLVIAKEPLSEGEHKALHLALLELNSRRPITGALELSVVTSAIAKAASVPIRYELHFSEGLEPFIRDATYDYQSTKRFDLDLGAHFTIAKRRGVSLIGKTPAALLGDISWDDYLAAVLDDLTWILEGDHIVESPFYCILNCCRALQMLKLGNGTVASKEEGALWALEALPKEHRTVIDAALSCYRSSDPVSPEQRKTGGREWNDRQLRFFRDFVRREIVTRLPEMNVWNL